MPLPSLLILTCTILYLQALCRTHISIHCDFLMHSSSTSSNQQYQWESTYIVLSSQPGGSI